MVAAVSEAMVDVCVTDVTVTEEVDNTEEGEEAAKEIRQ